MSRTRNTIEKTFADLPRVQQHIAAAIGSRGLEAMLAGVYPIAQWLRAMAECQAQHPDMSFAERKQFVRIFGDYEKQLGSLLNDAAAKRDGGTIRMLADAIELTGPAMPVQPLESLILSLNANGAKVWTDAEIQDYIAKISPDKIPSIKTVQRKRMALKAPKAPEVKRGPKPGTKRKAVHRARR